MVNFSISKISESLLTPISFDTEEIESLSLPCIMIIVIDDYDVFYQPLLYEISKSRLMRNI